MAEVRDCKQKKYYEIGEIGGEYVSYQDYETRFRIFWKYINYQEEAILMKLQQKPCGNRPGSRW